MKKRAVPDRATAGSGKPDFPIPCNTPMLAPIDPIVCWALKGGRVPRL